MPVKDMVLRLYTSPDGFEPTIAFYETLQGAACTLRFENAEKRIKGVRIGGVLILSGADADLQPLRAIGAVFYVDSLDDLNSWLEDNGAEILHPPQTIAFGRNMTVRNPDGLTVEYFEPRTA